MEGRAPQSLHAKEAVLAAVCIAGAVWCVSCGGGGSTYLLPPAPGFSLSSTNINFANQGLGTTSAPLSATLTNIGGASLTLTSVEVSGSDAADFMLTNNCGSSLAPSGQCTLTLTFKPSSIGARSASIVFADNAAGSPQTIGLSGTGTSPEASLSTSNLAFGSQAVAMTSAVEIVTLTNTGNVTLSISSLAIQGANVGDFDEVADTCGGSVAAGGACTIGVAFTPGAGGNSTATLSITDNAPGSPQTVSLSGTGSHDVILYWTGSSTTGNITYNVYRGTTPGGESSQPLNATPINGTAYVDASVMPGGTYYYVVRTVGPNGEQSAVSGETEATVPAD